MLVYSGQLTAHVGTESPRDARPSRLRREWTGASKEWARKGQRTEVRTAAPGAPSVLFEFVSGLGEVLSDQLIRGCCIDRLSWHDLPGKWNYFRLPVTRAQFFEGI